MKRCILALVQTRCRRQGCAAVFRTAAVYRQCWWLVLRYNDLFKMLQTLSDE